MNAEQIVKERVKHQKPKSLEHDKGFYHSCTIRKSFEEVVNFLSDKTSIQKVIDSLPPKAREYFDLNKVDFSQGKEEGQINWQTPSSSKLKFQAVLTASHAPADRGTIVSAEAYFEVPHKKILNDLLNMEDTNPSLLVGVFLHRFKTLIETGEIPTTEGQPSGREELSQNKFLH